MQDLRNLVCQVRRTCFSCTSSPFPIVSHLPKPFNISAFISVFCF
nr:MAG TPA: hypothetical protein [Caudoviricetes sp.]